MFPMALLLSLPVGTRVVVRYRIEGGLTDALGDLVQVDAERCTVRTRRGDVVVLLTEVTAAKEVPPASRSRSRRA